METKVDPCPRCGGKGDRVDVRIVHRRGAAECVTVIEPGECQSCKGTGVLTERRRWAMDAGKKAKEWRLAAEMTFEQAAKWHGVTIPQWSDFERGVLYEEELLIVLVINLWHLPAGESPFPDELYKALGWTPQEYWAWVSRPTGAEDAAT